MFWELQFPYHESYDAPESEWGLRLKHLFLNPSDIGQEKGVQTYTPLKFNWVVVSSIFLKNVHPYLGKIPILTIKIFQMGWFNHQPANDENSPNNGNSDSSPFPTKISGWTAGFNFRDVDLNFRDVDLNFRDVDLNFRDGRPQLQGW